MLDDARPAGEVIYASGTMRLAFLSDIHGNPIALDAVLADVQDRGGVDGYWILGDLAAIGYDPVTVLERLVTLPNVRIVQGNTDRYVVTGERPPPTAEDVQTNLRLLPQLVEVAQSFAWTQGYVSAAGWLDWLAALPLEQRATLPDGTQLLGVHVGPGQNDGFGVNPTLSDEQLGAMCAGCDADLVCVGHTHWPQDRSVDGVRVVNVGSISNPLAPDLRASYVVLEASTAGYHVKHRRVDYDHDAVVAAVERSGHPSGSYISSHFRGQRRPWWVAA